jgi:hypothetical protein
MGDEYFVVLLHRRGTFPYLWERQIASIPMIFDTEEEAKEAVKVWSDNTMRATVVKLQD